jgi:hypothetical protein
MNWREIGDTTLETYRAEFERYDSPMLPFVDAVYKAARPHSALLLAKMQVEQKYVTWPSVIPLHYHNPCSLARPKGTPGDGVNRWERYASFADGVAACRERITSPTYKDGVYAKTVTVADLIRVFAPPSENDTNLYIDTVQALLAKWPRSVQEEPSPMALTFGKVPHPSYLDRPISKPENFGQNNLGKRTPKFVVLHRMLGSLWGTDGFFRLGSTGALTDYGVGVTAQDGEAQAGVVIRWNDPRGFQSGWASGPVQGPYGDGLAIVNKYGVNAVNKDGVSIEISGFQATPLDPEAFEAVAALMAYWWDQMKVPHTSAPINPATGISAVIYHQEFTLGSGKECPFQVVIEQTDALIKRATAICKQHQETITGTTAPPTTKPTYASPKPIKALAALEPDDIEGLASVVAEDGQEFRKVTGTVKAVNDTPRYQVAKIASTQRVGPDIKKGAEFAPSWEFTAADGEGWYLTPGWTRIRKQDTAPV